LLSPQAYNCQQSNIQNAIAIEANSSAITFKSHYEKAMAQQYTSSANAANTIANQALTANTNASQHSKVRSIIQIISKQSSA